MFFHWFRWFLHWFQWFFIGLAGCFLALGYPVAPGMSCGPWHVTVLPATHGHDHLWAQYPPSKETAEVHRTTFASVDSERCALKEEVARLQLVGEIRSDELRELGKELLGISQGGWSQSTQSVSQLASCQQGPAW